MHKTHWEKNVPYAIEKAFPLLAWVFMCFITKVGQQQTFFFFFLFWSAFSMFCYCCWNRLPRTIISFVRKTVIVRRILLCFASWIVCMSAWWAICIPTEIDCKIYIYRLMGMIEEKKSQEFLKCDGIPYKWLKQNTVR